MAEQSVRKAILDACRDLLYERGYEGTSMRDIARRVGLVPSSLYTLALCRPVAQRYTTSLRSPTGEARLALFLEGTNGFAVVFLRH